MKLLTLILLSLLSSAVTADISGTALIVDGDTIAISGMKVRLSGIDTPERKQTCRKAGVTWRCGYEATETLREWTHTKEVRCIGDEKDKYGRLIADCFVDGYNLNARLVYEGMALAYRRYSKK
jgi:endonuclease YncB( thermonuclease family)